MGIMLRSACYHRSLSHTLHMIPICPARKPCLSPWAHTDIPTHLSWSCCIFSESHRLALSCTIISIIIYICCGGKPSPISKESCYFRAAFYVCFGLIPALCKIYSQYYFYFYCLHLPQLNLYLYPLYLYLYLAYICIIYISITTLTNYHKLSGVTQCIYCLQFCRKSNVHVTELKRRCQPG